MISYRCNFYDDITIWDETGHSQLQLIYSIDIVYNEVLVMIITYNTQLTLKVINNIISFSLQ